MNGILIVDKPAGVTSAEVVRSVKRSARVKVGHLGTLDPFASGLLPLCLGEATKIAQFLNAVGKTYEGTIQLGQATDTGDCTGTITSTAVIPTFDPTTLAAVAQQFLGTSEQVPPMYSALKRDGVPLYKLARQGIEVERASRTIHIEDLHLEPAEDGQLRFAVSVSKGTYVRVLAEDIARAMGTVAHVKSLRRTRFGSFTLSHAVGPGWEPGAPGLLSIREALGHLPCIAVDADGATAARRGQGWWLAKAMANREGPEVVLIDPEGDVVAVVEKQGNHWQFARVLVPAQTLQGGAPMVGPHTKQDG
jgi:tRNA pseudouridine55 synthase